MSLYWLLLARKKVSKKVSIPPAVSILIPSHNAARTLIDLLSSLEGQSYPSAWEIIVVADRCTDETVSLAQKYQQNLPLRVVEVSETPLPWSPKKYALWRAALEAQYDWCIVLDADTKIPHKWLETMMERGEGKAVICPAWLIAEKSWASFFFAYEAALVQLEALGRASWGFPYMSTGRGWAIRRAWLLAGLYAWRETLSGDDDLTLQLMPSRGISIAPTYTISAAPATFSAGIQRKWRHLQAARHYPIGLRLSLAFVPFLQLCLIGLIPFAQLPLLLPPIAKLISLKRWHAPYANLTFGLDWILLILQVMYPVGVWRKKLYW